MSVYNYTEFIADRLKRVFPGTEVYSNIDPTREFQGALMLEVAETREPEQKHFISGAVQTTRFVSVTVRAKTHNEAGNAASLVRLHVEAIINDLVDAGRVYAWTFEAIGTTPDVRGMVSGETFYGYLDYIITERE